MFRVFSIIVFVCLTAAFTFAHSEKRSLDPRINRKPILKTHAHGIEKTNNRTTVIGGKATLKETIRKPSNETIRKTSNDMLVDSPCTCAVFLSGQFIRGSQKSPTGYPLIFAELEDQFSCDSTGVKRCISKCLENLTKYIPKSVGIVCASINRECFKERAYLFVKNCRSGWVNTNMAAGREFCCKNNEFYKCPNV